jgi:CheY-like chemotaxis protein
MIVDDDRITVRLLTTLLEIDGFDVSVAPTGREVVTLARQVRPDLILMDYHLEDMDGVQVVHQIRALPEFQHLPIIMVSGMNVEPEALAAGSTCFLMKPFDPDSLQNLFNSLINA